MRLADIALLTIAKDLTKGCLYKFLGESSVIKSKIGS